MPRKYLMTFNATSARWFKKFKGKQYAVSCSTLGTVSSIEASWRAANDWWQAKRLEIETGGRHPKYDDMKAAEPKFAAVASFLESHDDPEMGSRYKLFARMMGLMAELPPGLHFDPPDWLLDPRVVHQADDPKILAGLSRIGGIAEAVLADQDSSGNAVPNTIAANVERFVARKRVEAQTGKITYGRYDELQRRINYFADFAGRGNDCSSITGRTIEEYNSHLLGRIAAGEWSLDTAKNNWVAVKQFVRWCYQSFEDGIGLAELPRNMADRSLRIQVETKEVKTFPLPMLKKILDACQRNGQPTVAKLYLLLMMNCGMTQIDVSDLQPRQVDWQRGTITRKRSKTKKWENVPTVCYQLWPETFALLKKFGSEKGHAVATILNGKPSKELRVLVTLGGKALVSNNVSHDTSHRKSDTIRSAYGKVLDRLKLKKGERPAPKLIRKTSSSFVEKVGRCGQYFLGHAPRSVADKHYLLPDQDQFDGYIDQLGTFYGILTADPVRQNVKAK